MPGCEPFSAAGGRAGALVLHGFTGNPQSMRGLAQAFAAAGFTVELPLLPGHGTSIEDMVETGWHDWSTAVEAAYQDLAARCERVVVAGLSMGGTLATWIAAHHPEVAGLIAINAAVEPATEETIGFLRQTVESGTEILPAIGSDVADPDSKELAYEGTPLRPLLTLMEAQEDIDPRLGEIRCPVLILTSRNDHVVPPTASDYLAERVSGPVERVWYDRSYHVITLDYDKADVEARAVEFAKKVTAS
jgi:carboxylesterase